MEGEKEGGGGDGWKRGLKKRSGGGGFVLDAIHFLCISECSHLLFTPRQSPRETHFVGCSRPRAAIYQLTVFVAVGVGVGVGGRRREGGRQRGGNGVLSGARMAIAESDQRPSHPATLPYPALPYPTLLYPGQGGGGGQTERENE